MSAYMNEDFQEKMKLRLNFNNMMEAFVGEKGIQEEEIAAIAAEIEDAEKAMVAKRANGGMDWRDLPYNQDQVVEDILEYAAWAKEEFDAFVVLGIGGSALGPIALQQALNHPYYNELSKEKRGGWPKFYVADNVDPERLVYLFQTIDPARTLFNVTSKSGGTSETMSQFMIIKSMLEEQLGKEEAAKHIVCTTDAEKGNLRPICDQEGYKSFVIPAGVGGRFSELTPVGLLPAAMTGIDIKELLAGAAFMDEQCKEEDTYRNIGHMYGILSYLAMKQGKNIQVMMPYADSLKYMADWFAQLWAESLGKKYNNDGQEVFAGQTPVKALGVTDQHSQVQLYAEGPFDKMIVFLGVDQYREEIVIPKIYGEIPSLGFLGGASHSQLIQTEQMATEYALLKAGKMNMTLTVPQVNAFTMGELLYLFEVATAFAGELLQINAFDQPGVEGGKNATYAMFGRPGYEDVKKELDSRPEADARFII
ncbi:glucose-6-phosphate isomerase [Bianquea renquensis]|uniref:Glucose-6-phosphate isomerase n=1 Tax=Bianquea renquensis TaxID=2763661 RepID=A0A926I1Q7_9FIRM|nr:glucose-6-phosphate isomerase [Bianquea renquensis]MBC8543678.1 glucose-6-phosphate isomerase [Bianquea renquensis]